MRPYYGLLLIVPLIGGVFLISSASAQLRGFGGDTNPCVSKLNCSECIRTPSCAWCAQPVSKSINLNLVTQINWSRLDIWEPWRSKTTQMQPTKQVHWWCTIRPVWLGVHHQSWFWVQKDTWFASDKSQRRERSCSNQTTKSLPQASNQYVVQCSCNIHY